MAIGKVERDKTKDKIYREKLVNWIVAFGRGGHHPSSMQFHYKIESSSVATVEVNTQIVFQERTFWKECH